MKRVPDFEDRYSVDKCGKVFSHIRKKWLKPIITKDGYHYYSFFDGLKYKKFSAHRLVLITYVRKPNVNEVGMHIDSNPGNNRLQNLKWGTQKENQKQRIDDGTDVRGAKHPKAKLSNQDVRNIKIRIKNEKGKDLAEEYNVSPSLISLIKRGKVRSWL